MYNNNKRRSLGVVVTGISMPKQNLPEEKEDTNPAIDNKSDKKEDGNFFKSMKEFNNIGVNATDTAHLIMVEFKRVYIECLIDQKFGIDELEYLDNTVFNALENVIKCFIETKSKDKLDSESIQDGINTIITDSIKLLDYETIFDFKKMFLFVSDFVTYFTK